MRQSVQRLQYFIIIFLAFPKYYIYSFMSKHVTFSVVDYYLHYYSEVIIDE